MHETWGVQGSKLIEALIESPTILGILALVWIVILVALVVRKSSRSKQLVKLTVAVIATIAVIVALAYSFRPGTQYGITLNGENATIVFFEDKHVEFNICNSEIRLLNRTTAISMLHIRKMGVYDPSTGIISGYFVTDNGTTIYAIITGKNISQVLMIKDASHTAIVGVPGIVNAYRTLTGIQERCGK